MDNVSIHELRDFFAELVNHPFLLERVGVRSIDEANDFVGSHQEEEPVYEAFVLGLINQVSFYPPDPNRWVSMARKCNFDHPAILDDKISLDEGGPIAEWYIYPMLLKWLVHNAPQGVELHLNEKDITFLHYEVPSPSSS